MRNEERGGGGGMRAGRERREDGDQGSGEEGVGRHEMGGRKHEEGARKDDAAEDVGENDTGQQTDDDYCMNAVVISITTILIMILKFLSMPCFFVDRQY